MGKTATRLFRNSIWNLWQRFGTRGISFALAIILVRKLGAEAYGTLSYGLSVASLFVIFADLGLSTLAIREIARNREGMPGYFGRAAALKLVVTALAFTALAAFLVTTIPNRSLVLLMTLLGVCVFAQNTGAFFASVFQAWERMHLTALVETAQKCALLALCIVVLAAGHGLAGVAWAYALTGLLALVLSVVIVHKAFPAPIYKLDAGFCRRTIRQALPFAAIVLISTTYFRLDMVMLKHIKNAEEVGWYSVGYNLYYALATAFSAFLAAVFPLMSRLAGQSDGTDLDKVIHKSLRLIVGAGIPLAAGGFLLANGMIELLFGAAYSPSARAFQLFALMIPVGFLNSFGCYLLTATDRASVTMKALALTTLVNASLNYFLIGPFGFQGAVYATMASEFIFVVLLFINAPNLVRPIFSASSLRVILATAAMCAAILLSKRLAMHTILIFAVGSAVYTLILLASGFVTDDERQLVRSLWRDGDR